MWARRLLRQSLQLLKQQSLGFWPRWSTRRLVSAAQLAGVGSCVCAVGMTVRQSLQPSAAAHAEVLEAQGDDAQRKLSWREQRFLAFASLEYNGVAYLSPDDFLKCVTAKSVTRKKRRRVLSEAEYRAMLSATPPRWKASQNFFRDLGPNGIVSYAEFLLLLSLLSRSCAGYQLAFRVFDRNSDGNLDAEEFQILCKVASSKDSSAEDDLDGGPVSTSLSVHFFGHNFLGRLTSKEFDDFADNLQKEVLKVEFLDASHGRDFVTGSEFGVALLSRTNLSPADRRLRLQLLHDRDAESCRISCKQYQQFFQFLHNIEDLFYALRMYEISEHSIGQEDFQSAVMAVTGSSVPPHMLTVVFALFDIDGDGCLSYSEFLNLFRDSEILKASRTDESQWMKFRKCVKRQMQLQ